MFLVRENVPLAPLTTFGIGGSARYFIEASSEEDIHAALAFARERGVPLYVLGAGSNVLVPDEGVPGVVLKVIASDMRFEDCGGEVFVHADAGARFDTLVDAAVERGLFGIENLAGVPGSVGGATVQNIGAYGAELAQTFAYAEVIDRTTGVVRRVERDEAAFGYRTSLFKVNPNLIVMHVAFRLAKRGKPNVAYPDLVKAAASGTALSTPAEVARAIRAIRANKFPAWGVLGTAGSFFKNPILPQVEADALRARYPELPVFPQEGGSAKVSLAWLLDHALSLKGFGMGSARLYERQPLVLVAERGAAARDVHALADEVTKRVHDAFHINLEREVETFGA